MPKLTFYSSRPGVRKDSFVRMLRAELRLKVREAKAILMQVLENQPVTLELADAMVETVREQAETLGVRCRLD